MSKRRRPGTESFLWRRLRRAAAANSAEYLKGPNLDASGHRKYCPLEHSARYPERYWQHTRNRCRRTRKRRAAAAVSAVLQVPTAPNHCNPQILPAAVWPYEQLQRHQGMVRRPAMRALHSRKRIVLRDIELSHHATCLIFHAAAGSKAHLSIVMVGHHREELTCSVHNW